MDLGIAGRRAAVAAGTAGLGYAAAAALVGEGVRVTVCGSDAERAAAAGAALGADHVVADLSGPDGARAFVREAGEVDILVVNGPGPAPGTALSASDDDYRDGVDRSLLAPMAMCRAAVPGMRARGWGRVVAVTSLGVRQPYPNLAPSNAARAGFTGFLRTLAREIAADGVTVNSVLPGLHATGRVRSVYGEDGSPALDAALATIPVGRLGRPDELGAVVAFLCSEHAGYLTGAAVTVDGGAYQGFL